MQLCSFADMTSSLIFKCGLFLSTATCACYCYKEKILPKTTVFATTAVEASRWNEDWDKRAHEKPSATRHLILVRHGEESDHFLTKLGREQATLTGKRLKELCFDKKVSKVIESTMHRAKETSMLMSRELNLDESTVQFENSDLLKTGTPVEPDMQYDHYSGDLSKPQSFFVDGARIETAFRQFIHRADVEQQNDSVELIVTHGNVICYFVCRALQLPLEAIMRMTVAHTSITQLYIWPNGRCFLKGLGDVGHIPADKITYD